MIETIKIKKVGPIQDRVLRLKNNNLIIGNNETGKTTIGDILERYLLKNKKKSEINLLSKLSGFNDARYDQWEYEIEGDSGIEYFADDPNYINVVNLLVVREAGNKLTDRDSKDITFADFWKNSVRTLLGGFESSSERLEKLRKYLNVNAGPWKILDSLELYKNRLIEEKRRVAMSDISHEEIEDNEKKLKDKMERLEVLSKIEKANEFYEAEENFVEYVKLVESIKEIKKFLDENDINQLEHDREEWKECAKFKTEFEKERTDKERGLIEMRNEIQKKISNRESERRILKEREKKLEERISELHNRSIRVENEFENEQAKIEDKIRNIQLEREKLEKKDVVSGMFIFPAGVFLAGISSFAMSHLWQYMIFISIVIVLAGASLVIKDVFVFNKRKRDKARKLEKMEEIAEKFKNDLKRIEERLEMSEQTSTENIANVDRELKEIKSEVAGIDEELRIWKNGELDQINEHYTSEMKRIEDKIKGNQKKIDTHLMRYGDQTRLGGRIFEYHSKESDLAEETSELNELAEELKDIFDMEEVSITRIENKLDMMKKNIEKSYIDMDYDPEERERLIKEINELKEEKYDRNSEVSGIRSEIVGRLSKDFSSLSSPVKWGDKFFNRYFLPLVINLKVTNVYELDRAIKRTEDSIEKIKKYASYAEKMLVKIREIENDQNKIAGAIIHSNEFYKKINAVSGYEIGEIAQEGDRFNILFRRQDELYRLEQLSTGAINQFYFVFRVTLAERILSVPGLFILDDAFIHFDREKRKKSFLLMKELAEAGWQFIYTGVADGSLDETYQEVFGKDANIIEL